MTKPLAVLIVAVAGACAAPPPIPDSVALDDDAYTALRTDVTAAVAPSCGSCHTTGSAEAKPAALAIFDLTSTTWPEHLWAGGHAIDFQRRAAGTLDAPQELALADLLGAARQR